ncbi:Hint domain-containing protein [Paracoccus sulfuroxidans]|uniref:Ca2+-binding RTX toxin-like protein n=1 Tax=Paracoccus sulfuroxidans TaxID=384678 RepID=A0A562NH03_9RHOB|nr:Hint domain-containing protein [Paracoccus sulfuroxidans]TWI31191.1 Ca2+-binding RTX toxin-like protein [Paracoccus sulfuroxidans]
MAVGYLVSLGSDLSAWNGDTIALTQTTFTPVRALGTDTATVGSGTWSVTGVLSDGTQVTNQILGGTYQTDSAGNLYFVPDVSMTSITSATVGTSPIYNGPTTLQQGNSFSNIMTGGTTPNTLDGLGGNDSLLGSSDFLPGGGDDRDVLNGGAGNDTLRGGNGNDRLTGGTGNDSLQGGAGADIADYSGATSGVNITLPSGGAAQTLTNTQTGGMGQDTLQGMDGLIGSAFADTLIGYDGHGTDPDGNTYTNHLDGGAGNDYIDGKTGGDYLFGGSGDDTVIGGLANGTQIGAYDDQIFGGDGNDVLYGDDTLGTDPGGGNDLIQGGAGNDSIIAGAGNDLVFGDADNDTIRGGAGNDTIYGGTGNDSLFGDAGNDVIHGGDGADTIQSGLGDDLVHGGAGGDHITNEGGRDTIYGEAGNDTILSGGSGAAYGGDGDDELQVAPGGSATLFGDAGNDRMIGHDTTNDLMYGGDGDDGMVGNGGDDSLYGDAGNDTINGFSGNDFLYGGSGNDLIGGGIGNDSIEGGTGDDTLYGDSYLGPDTVSGGDDTIRGDEGNDLIYGGAGQDLIYGGADNDTIHGGDGNDTLHGDAGNDSILGGAGNDSILGGAGNDYIEGGTGRDTIDGGAGNDVISGGAPGADDNQADMLTGGEGFDTFIAGNGDTILDFNTGAGQNISDNSQTNNDFVNLSGYYNTQNLAIYNAWAQANGQKVYATPLGWLRGDQSDGVLNDISTGHGFGQNFTFTIQTNGTQTAGNNLTWDNTSVVCFGSDALIETQNGPVPAGKLQVGDLVRTQDAGLQPIRWIGKRSLDEAALSEAARLRPIRIRAGALGDGLPSSDLIVSPQHRMLVRSKITRRMFGCDEVLIAAKQLLQIDGIEVAEDLTGVTYVHFLFDAHQIVFANGAASESMHTGEQALKSIGPSAVAEIHELFPELRNDERQTARLVVQGRTARKLAERHSINRKCLVS